MWCQIRLYHLNVPLSYESACYKIPLNIFILNLVAGVIIHCKALWESPKTEKRYTEGNMHHCHPVIICPFFLQALNIPSWNYLLKFEKEMSVCFLYACEDRPNLLIKYMSFFFEAGQGYRSGIYVAVWNWVLPYGFAVINEEQWAVTSKQERRWVVCVEMWGFLSCPLCIDYLLPNFVATWIINSEFTYSFERFVSLKQWNESLYRVFNKILIKKNIYFVNMNKLLHPV